MAHASRHASLHGSTTCRATSTCLQARGCSSSWPQSRDRIGTHTLVRTEPPSVLLSEWCWLGSCSVQPSDEVCLLISDDCGSGLRLIHLDSHVCCRPPPPQSPWPHRHPCTLPTSTPTMAVGLCLYAGPRRPIVAAGQFALFQRHGSAAAKRGAALRASTPRRWRQWRRRQWRRRWVR